MDSLASKSWWLSSRTPHHQIVDTQAVSEQNKCEKGLMHLLVLYIEHSYIFVIHMSCWNAGFTGEVDEADEAIGWMTSAITIRHESIGDSLHAATPHFHELHEEYE